MQYSMIVINQRRLLTGVFSATCLLIGLLLFMPEVYAGNCDVIDKNNPPTALGLPGSAIDTDQIPQLKIDADARSDQPLPVYKLTHNSYMLFGNISTLNQDNRGFNANAGFIVTQQGVIVIDTLGTPRLAHRMLASIRCITDKPVRFLIVTHNHPDHSYGSAAFSDIKGITIIAHPSTLAYNQSETLVTSVNYRRQMLTQEMTDFRPLQADIYLETEPFSKKRIRLGDEVIDIYNTGNHHSYGDLVVHQPGQKILWVSDLVFNQRTTYIGDGDSAQILKTQDWLLQTFPDTRLMVPGHGSAQTAPFPMVGKTSDYVSRMRKAMHQAVDDGVSMLDAVEAVEFEDWQNVPLYENNQRANANFVYREMEKAYFDDFKNGTGDN